MTPEETELLVTILGRLMNQPAAPYHELLVQKEAMQIIQDYSLALDMDEYGTLWVGLRGTTFPSFAGGDSGAATAATDNRMGTTAPSDLILAAHLDHPGFEFLEWHEEKNLWKSKFQGGVGRSYFQESTPLQIYPGNRRGWLRGAVEGEDEKEKLYWVEAPEVAPGEAEFGVWDLDAFRMEEDRIHGRACDDLVGVAAALVTLILVQKRWERALENSESGEAKAPPSVWAMLSRAEEVGFQGALVAMDRLKCCANPWVISLEASKEIPAVSLGAGVIIRVGDRSSVFDSASTLFLQSRAEKLNQGDNGFEYQMAWMGGGSCEGTAFQSRGFRTGAMCVPLLKYHNQGDENRIAEESIHLRDARTMTELLVQSAVDLDEFYQPTHQLGQRMDGLRESGLARLKKSS